MALDTGIVYEFLSSNGTWTAIANPAGSGMVGPVSSVDLSVPVFNGTTGQVLADSATTLKVIVPPGSIDVTTYPVGPGFKLGVQFSGMGAQGAIAANTGFKTETYGSNPGPTTLEVFNSGWSHMAWEFAPLGSSNGPNVGGSLAVTTIRSVLRSDSGVPVDIGRAGNSFINVYANRYGSGYGSNGVNPLFDRSVRYTGAYNGGINDSVYGIGLNDINGSEIFFNLTPDNSSHWLDAFTFKSSTVSLSIISAKDNAAADAVNAVSMRVSGANKTDGTGNGGNVIVKGGTTVGGEPGHFFVPSTAGAPTSVPDAVSGCIAMQFDSTNSKLYAYIGGAWVAVTLS